jgi:HD-GYP domain-containing protein (c-di-GMP phosphodiesterase class II)
MSKQEELDLHRNAKDIINQISIVVRTAQIHDANNVAISSAISRLVSMINNLLDKENTIQLELRGELFYINEYRIRYSLEYMLNFDFLVREFKRRATGKVIFRHQLKMEDIRLFTKAFNTSQVSDDPFHAFQEKLSGVQSIEIGRLQKIIDGTDSQDLRKMIKKTYFNAVSHTKTIMNKMKNGETVNLKKAKRIMESMVDHILEEEQLLLGMTAIKDYDEYTYHHSVNVSILSISLGQRLGLSRKMLTELGMVALFHDTGKIEVPTEVLNKPTSFNDDDWKIIKKHPIWGLRAILKLKRLDDLTIRSAIVSFEHHMNIDRSGYPQARQPMKLDLFSRIVSLADQYDAMTSSRVYARTPLAPDKALSIMMDRSGTQLDPLLFKFFVNMVGIYPIGTLVILDTRELGLVTESNQLFPTRPRVLLITDSQGKRREGHLVDLAEKDGRDHFVRSIKKTMDPNKYHINLSEYLL